MKHALNSLLTGAGSIKINKILMFFAVIASVISVIYFSGEKAKEFWPRMMMICLGLAAVGFHLTGAQNAAKSWNQRNLGTFCGWLLVAGMAFLWEMNSQLSISSSNQGELARAQLTAFVESGDTRSTLDAAEQKARAEFKTVEAMRKQLFDALPVVDGRTIETVAAAKAEVTALEARKRFWDDLTEKCTKTAGKETRKFCDDHKAAKQAVANLEGREALKAELKAAELGLKEAEAELKQAKAQAKTTKVVSSGERHDTANFIRASNAVGFKPSSEDVSLIQSLLVPVVLGFFLFGAGWMMKMEELPPPSRSWAEAFGLAWLGTKIARLWDGKTQEEVLMDQANRGALVFHEKTVVDTGFAARSVAAIDAATSDPKLRETLKMLRGPVTA